ncbi:SDR family NAD(P)-dependent oxidoreductase [Bacillus sp. H-16]|uniref:SDR family NAD(P)-dependent oxidoreductase n=1 Tax=Alteribacter salitolerans TaxID=2912333 RepID=UPI001966CB05|nr:SDR family NAD(P)-dependent oxidoreductase [Alteribacter salitolerans]MBM7096832.1 SDR family NAD(P)-dependent oxidoreductase [Alteribacter salitolerans]
MNKVLVTGGAGFIGSHVVDMLLKKKMNVVILDNLSTGTLKNLDSSLDEVSFCEGSITHMEAVQNVFQLHPDIDHVIHMAAQSKVGPSLENPVADAGVNITGTINLLECSRKANVRTFIYASSAAVYGETSVLPIKEQHEVNPLSPYGVSKLAAEEYVKTYGRLYDMEVKCLRFANVYGPRQSAATESGVITIFIEDLINGKRPVIFGDGLQTRDFIFVKDVARAVCQWIDEKSDSFVYNVSSGEETSIEELLKVICESMGQDYSPRFEKERPGDIKRSYLDNVSLCRESSWTVDVPLNKGLEETIDYYRKK